MPRMHTGIVVSALVAALAANANAADETAQTAAAAVTAPVEMPCEQHPFSILVTVTNVEEPVGLITLDLHGDDPKKFMKSGAKLARIRVPAVAGETKICVPVDRAGVYAAVLYHDRDSNLKLNKNWIGIPVEPFGVSNDPPLRLAVPKHKEAAFTVDGPLTPITITLRKY